MEQIICKHFYSDIKSNFISDSRFDIYKDLKELAISLVYHYQCQCLQNNIGFDISNVQIYRCGSISELGEFRIYSNSLPMYLKDILEAIKND